MKVSRRSSNYPDILCDRSASLNPDDFRVLHLSMHHALTPTAVPEDYYRLREEQDDGGYLASFVKTCQEVLAGLPSYDLIAPHLHELADCYCDLQVYKHVRKEDRVPLLKAWFDRKKDSLPAMEWYEFAACSGSTAGIFCLVARDFHQDCSASLVRNIEEAY
ncbi:MAG: DUF2600 family protein, partial [Syntrophales bacterium]|nr:DUF2600 family protein [Syntrophales bacterium]